MCEWLVCSMIDGGGGGGCVVERVDWFVGCFRGGGWVWEWMVLMVLEECGRVVMFFVFVCVVCRVGVKVGIILIGLVLKLLMLLE